MKRLVIVTLALLIFAFPLTVYAGETYKSATEYDYPPFSVTDQGEADGFSVELLQAVADTMGLEISFKIDSWSILKEELKNGDLDVLPLVGYTEERDRDYDFTVPYIIMHGNIFIRKDETGISTEEDLVGKEVIVMEGDNAHEYALRMGLSDHLILTETYPEAFELLASGKHDAVLAQSLVGEQIIEQYDLKGIKAATQIDETGLKEIRTNLSGFEQKFCFAVPEGNKDLLAKLNEGLAVVSANGEFDRLYQKWFPFIVNSQVDPIEVLKTSIMIITPIILLFMIAGIISVRRNIKLKTEELQRSHKAIIEMEAHLRAQQKLEAIGVLASGVAHEINNPVNGILNYGQLISEIAQNGGSNDKEDSELILNFSNEIINESNRISTIVSNLLQLSRTGSKQFYPCKIEEVINKLLSLVTIILKRDQIEIELNIADHLPKVECREQELQQVILNLIVNAKDALNLKYQGYHKDKRIILTVAEAKLINGYPGIRITIEDHGGGIAEDIRIKIFDPFFTTKSRADGTGLGLSISYGIIKDHKGVLSFDTKEGEYTRFYIDLPIKQV